LLVRSDFTDDRAWRAAEEAHELWSVDNNLNLANVDWDEFADNVDRAGVFRGFPS